MADEIINNTDTGTNDPVRETSQTQSTPGLNPNAGTGTGINFDKGTGINFNTGTGLNPVPANERGTGAPSEDAGISTKSSNQQAINTADNTKITPKENVLDQYASYTYSLSLYLITPQQFNDLSDDKRNFSSWSLLVQSGGAQANPATNSTSGRNPYFNLDYYIDDLVIETKIAGQGTYQAHNAASLSFKIYEPNGLTFVTALSQAVQNLYKGANAVGSDGNPVPWTAAYYVMVIRFYGYNDAGDLVQAGTTNAASGGTATGAASAKAQGAVVTKIYPFNISKLNFRLTNRNVEYVIEGKPFAYSLNASAMRGSIPQSFNLVGTTLQNVLNGSGGSSFEVSADDSKRSTTTEVPTPAPAPASRTEVDEQVRSAAYKQNAPIPGGPFSRR